MARYSLFVLKVPLNTNQLTNQPGRRLTHITRSLFQGLLGHCWKYALYWTPF